MNTLTKRERELVAIGAALCSNCASCIEFHIPEARAAGLSDVQIQEAIELADAVRGVSARNTKAAASKSFVENTAGMPSPINSCSCDQLDKSPQHCC